MGKQKAFTLIELLIVIAVIALLMSILVPALTRARELSYSIICRSNLKQWGAICLAYSESNDGNLWSGSNVSTQLGFWWPAQLERNLQGWKQNKIWFCPKSKRQIYDKTGQITGELNFLGAWGIYTNCTNPSNPSCIGQELINAGMPLLWDNEYGIAGSYGINGHCLSTRDRPDNWRSPNVKGPTSEIPLLADSLRFDGWPLETEGPASDEAAAFGANSMARFCINRHRGFTNVLFLDFSVRKAGLKELWKLKWHRTFNTNGIWTKAGGVQASRWPAWIRSYPDY